MARIIQGYALYNGTTGTYYGNNPQLVALNVDNFGEFSPRAGWLKRKIAKGVGGGSIFDYIPTFDANDPEIDSNTIRGIFVGQGAGLVMIDTAGVTAAQMMTTFMEIVDNCCDGVTLIPRGYASGVPSFSNPTTSTYTITREDAGTPGAIDQFSMDYMDQVVNDPVHTAWDGTTSTYQIQCFGTPTLVGSDVLV